MQIDISRILIQDRQRKEFSDEKIKALASSIANVGLLHPPVVREVPGSSPLQFRLVVGEGRIRAISSLTAPYNCGVNKNIPPNRIECQLITDLSPVQQYEAELHENLLRTNLTWKEEQEAFANLHELRRTQNAAQTIRDTAVEVQHETARGSIKAIEQKISGALLISKHQDNPSVRNARSFNEARNIALKAAEAELATALADRIKSSSPHRLFPGDMRTILPTFPAGEFDVILADPPYGMGADDFGKKTVKHTYLDDETYAADIINCILFEGFRITKPQAFIFLFCDIDLFLNIKQAARSAGWYPWRTPLVWNKLRGGIEPLPDQGFARAYELIFYGIKGNKLRHDFMTDVISIPPVNIPGMAAAKPIDLYRALLKRSCLPGDAVLDPCCSIGTIFHAARSLSLKATGIELSEENAKLAQTACDGTVAEEVRVPPKLKLDEGDL